MPIFGKYTVVELSGSCTIDEAVAKHLGWMQGAIRNQYVNVTEYGIPADQLANLPSHVSFNLSEQLSNMRNELYEKLEVEYQRCEDNDFSDMKKFDEIEDALYECESLIEKAAKYRCEIIDELAKKNESALRIDPTRSTAENIYITISSIEAWKQNKNDTGNFATAASTSQNGLSTNATAPKKPPRTKMRDQEDAILATIKKLGYDPLCLPKMDDGNPWVKSEVLGLLQDNELFTADRSFGNAWTFLNKKGLIVEGDTPYYKNSVVGGL